MPSSASTDIAAVMSATRSSRARSWMASTQHAEHAVGAVDQREALLGPSVERLDAGRAAPRRRHASPVDAPRPRRSARARSGRAARGRRSRRASRARGTTGVSPALSSARIASATTGPRARAAHRQRARAQQHHRPHDLGLDRRRPCRPRASGRARAAAPRAARPGSRRWRASRSRSRRRRRAPRRPASRATTAALASIARARLGRERRPRAPSRATATTSSGESPVPLSSITPRAHYLACCAREP